MMQLVCWFRTTRRQYRVMLAQHREREPGENPGLSRSGMQERPPSGSTGLRKIRDWEVMAIRSTYPVRACESEDLPAVSGAPRPTAHRLVEWAFGRNRCGYVPEVLLQSDRLCVRWR